jgi:hypothetical protein
MILPGVLFSRKGAKPLRKYNEIDSPKNLRVFAPLRETFFAPGYPG